MANIKTEIKTSPQKQPNSAGSIPTRDQVPDEHKWDLSGLYADDQAWADDLERLQTLVPDLVAFRGSLADSAARISRFLKLLFEAMQVSERLGYYAALRRFEDMGAPAGQKLYARYMRVASEFDVALSFATPEILRIADGDMEQWLGGAELSDYELYLRKMLRDKSHTLDEEQERLLSMQSEINQTANNSFHALLDADLDFGAVQTPEGDKPLTHATMHSFLLDQRREIRERAMNQFMRHIDAHRNTLASLYIGSNQLDVYKARVRKHPSARSRALFRYDMPEKVYDNLVSTVNANLAPLHRYYRLRRKRLGLQRLRRHDLYVPLVASVRMRHSYEEAVEVVIASLHPLGGDYQNTLRSGLLQGWVDRYENRGKRSGAYSAGSYHGDPYISMNFKEDDLRDVFTLAHEAGHSMHSFYAVANNPFQHYDYTIFEAEVASTFNEQLLARRLQADNNDDELRAYLLNMQIDDTIATLYRQTMFAEYEQTTHRLLEADEPLTLERLRGEYHTLLTTYFGSELEIGELDDLEGLRIPHFYNAFYVYQYATGISAAIALAQRVLQGGEAERQDYLRFLKVGGSRYPLEALRVAGVDMATPQPIERAIARFDTMVAELERCLL